MTVYEGGSSPLSRGILRFKNDLLYHGRIIPALAGNTFEVAFAFSTHSDHPRSRGEYALKEKSETLTNGSSPLSRGIRQAY